MTTPPFVPDNMIPHIMRDLRKRHAEAGDPTWGKITSDVWATLDYLRAYRGPDWVRHADIVDRQTLTVWLWWDDRRRELDVLTDGLRWGWTRRQLGAPLGVATTQGVSDRIDRLTALLRWHRPDEKLLREERRADRVTIGIAGDERATWLTHHHAELCRHAAALIDLADELAVDDRDMLDELAADLADDHWTPGSVAILGAAIREIRTDRRYLALTGVDADRVHTITEGAHLLESRYAGFGK